MATSSLTAAAAATAKMPEHQDKSQFKITDLNPHLSCILCGGYFIDATTITECLHSFCRACIVRYLETSKYCPVCEVQIHKTRPLRCIRSDKMLQDIVYKLVPGLYQNEMKRRRELYASQPPEALKESRDAEDRGEGMEDRFIYTADEIFHLSVDYVRHNGSGVTETVDADTHRRFLKCPAALTVFHLKKFIRLKYSIPNKYQVDLRYQEEEPLNDTYSLMDIAYIFAWKRKGLLSFSYRINEKPKKLTPRLRVVKPFQPEMKKDDVLMIDSEIMPSSDSTAAVPVVSDFIKCDTVKEKTVSETTTHSSSSATDHEEDVISNSTNNPLPESPKVNLTPIVSETPKPIVEKATKVYSGKSRKTSARSGKESSKRSSKKSHSSQSASAIKRSLPKICVSFLNNNSRRTGDGYTSSSIAIVPPTRVRSSSEKKASVPPPKVPKLTIPLTPKILQDANSLQQQELQQQQLEQQDQQPEKPEPQQEQPQRLQQDEEQQQQQQQQPVLEDQDTKDDEKMDSDRDLFDGGPLVIAEPLEDSVESKDHKLQISDDDAKEDVLKEADKMEEEIDVESCEVDSGRGSDTSCRTGDDDIGSPGSSTTVRTPDLDKSNPFPIPSPSSTASLPSPVSNMACHSYNIGSIFNGFSLASTLATTSSTTTATTLSPINGSMASSNSPQNHQKDDLGVLDLSTCHRKRGHDRLPVSRPRQVANPPVLDKHRQTTPCLPLPSHPSFKLLPAVLPHTSIYKKNTSSDFCRGNFRCKGSTLTAYNPDPNSNRPKIVIKSIESPRAEHGHGRHHHHHGHHHSHHHQRM